MSKFVDAYFFRDRKGFVNLTKMDSDMLSQILRFNVKDSLFAKLMQDIQIKIATSVGCSSKICSST